MNESHQRRNRFVASRHHTESEKFVSSEGVVVENEMMMMLSIRYYREVRNPTATTGRRAAAGCGTGNTTGKNRFRVIARLLSFTYASMISRQLWATSSHRSSSFSSSLSTAMPTTEEFVAVVAATAPQNDAAATFTVEDDRRAVVPVFLWPDDKDTEHSERRHIYSDGIDRSPFLRRSYDPNIFHVRNNNNNNNNTDSNSNSNSNNSGTTTTTNPITTVWVGEAYGGPSGTYRNFSDWCREFEVVVRKARESCLLRRRRRGGMTTTGGDTGCRWHIHIVDFEDWPKNNETCPGIEAAMSDGGSNNYVRYSQRSVVYHRRYNPVTRWIQPGLPRSRYLHHPEPAPPVVFPSVRGYTTTGLHQHRHIGFGVRSDTVRTLRGVVGDRNASWTLSDPIESLWDRPTDVAHFWPPPPPNENEGEEEEGRGTVSGRRPRKRWWDPRFRERVSGVLRDYCAGETRAEDPGGGGTTPGVVDDAGAATPTAAATTVPPRRPPRSCFVGLAGRKATRGRATANRDFVETMASAKIVVVSQRDQWEDHYRLFEALVSGAMVLTDWMWTLPHGYEDGVSIVVYRSEADLTAKLDRYLDPDHESDRIAIANAGRKLAMDRHRSWHRMEELIFGRALTVGDPPDDNERGTAVEESQANRPSSVAMHDAPTRNRP